MVKQIKKLTLLLFVAATMFSFASCSKDDDNKTTSDAPETVADTEWMWRAEGALCKAMLCWEHTTIQKVRVHCL